jgi:hypothetical protein
MGLSVLRHLGNSISLIDIDQSVGVPCRGLHLGHQHTDLAPVLLVCGGDMGDQQIARGIHRHMHFRAPSAFGPIIAHAYVVFGVDCRSRLSKMATEGSALLPWSSRNSARKSWTMPSNIQGDRS